MDVAVDVRRCDIFGQDVMIDEVLRPFRTIFKHRSHRRIGVDICILSLDVGVLGALEGQLVVDVHKIALSVANLRMFRAIEDVRLRRRGEVVLDEHLFHSILNEFNSRRLLPLNAVNDALRELFELLLGKRLVDRLKICLADGVGDLLGIKGHDLPRTFLNIFDGHIYDPSLVVFVLLNYTRYRFLGQGTKLHIVFYPQEKPLLSTRKKGLHLRFFKAYATEKDSLEKVMHRQPLLLRLYDCAHGERNIDALLAVTARQSLDELVLQEELVDETARAQHDIEFDGRVAEGVEAHDGIALNAVIEGFHDLVRHRKGHPLHLVEIARIADADGDGDGDFLRGHVVVREDGGCELLVRHDDCVAA